MKTMMLFKKTALLALVAALAVAALPLANVYAAGQSDPTPTPPAPPSAVSDERLEQAWARQQRAYDRLGRMFENSDLRISQTERYIEYLKGQGVDTSDLQAAVDAFAAAVKAAHPIYESINGILNSHQGFDAEGNVTDHDKAVETVQDMHAKMESIRQAMNGTGRALRELMHQYRETYPPPTPSAG